MLAILADLSSYRNWPNHSLWKAYLLPLLYDVWSIWPVSAKDVGSGLGILLETRATGSGVVTSANDVGTGLDLSGPGTGVTGTLAFFLLWTQSIVFFILKYWYVLKLHSVHSVKRNIRVRANQRQSRGDSQNGGGRKKNSTTHIHRGRPAECVTNENV